MKKFYFALAAVAAILAGCSKEVDNLKPEPVTPGEKAVSLKASVGDPQTKVSSDNAGVFKWQNTDKITVLTNNGNVRQFTIGEITDGTSAEFSGTIPDVSGETIKYALYPASASHFIDVTDKTDKKIRFHIDDRVIWDADASNMPMRAKVDGSASFKAVGGVLKLILFNIPAKADYLKFSATNKQISGDFDIADASIPAPVIATAAKDGNNNEQVIDFSANYSSSKVFYIPLPTGTIDGFTVALYETLEAEPLYTVTSTKSLSVTANKLIIAPAMNCAPTDVLWSEDFSSYSANDVPSGGTYSYVCANGGSDTKIYNEKLAGGSAPELLVGKSSGSFTASVPTNDAGTLTLKYKTNAYELALSSTTEGVSFSPASTSTAAEHTITITNSKNASSILITFTASSSKNVRLDDILLTVRDGIVAPVINTGDVSALTIALGETSVSTPVSLSGAVDGLGISAILSGTNADKFTASIAEGNLTVTAVDGANDSEDAYTATVTLKASGATSKVITVTQESALVPNPTDLAAVAGNATVDITWTGNANASSYVAYLHTAPAENPASGGTDISSSISHVDQAYIIDDYSVDNDQTYYVYVKVNGVAAGYVAPADYVVASFTPAVAKGTAANPYTVAEAILNTPASGTSDNVYIHGFVSAFYGSYTDIITDNYHRYYISDDGTTAQLLVFNGKGLNNVDFSSADDLTVGDEVTILGGLTTYNSTKEVAAGNYIVSRSIKCATPVFSPAQGTYYATQNVTITTSTADATIYYTTDGTEPTTGSTAYSEPIAVSADLTIKAIAVKESFVTSAVAEAAYDIEAPEKLSAPTITVDSFNHNSITFSWEAIEHATGYQVSIDGGSNWLEKQEELTYTWTGLSANTSYTVKVKAIGTDNGQYTDSDAASKSQTTAAPKTLVSIDLTTAPTKTTYNVNEAFSLAGAVVTATYSDESTADVTASCETVYDFSTIGNKTVTISYTEGGITRTCECNVTVAIVDVLTYSWMGISGSSYQSFSGVSGTASDAVYAGQAMTNVSYIQLRNTSPSGIVSTTSGGVVRKITVSWNSTTTDGRTLDIYGKNSAYTAPSELYGNSTAQGTKLGSIVKGTSTELTIDDDYEFVGLRSYSGAMYIDEIDIEWGEAAAVATPTFSVAGGNYDEAKSVTISCATDGAYIYYTTDGSTPTSGSTAYSTPINVNTSMTLKAIAIKGSNESAVASATYTLKVKTPTFSPAGGSYDSAQNVTISCGTEDATIHYTTDNTEPTTQSTTYEGAIAVSSTTTIRAIAVKNGWTNSAEASATYTIGGGGSVPDPETITFSVLSLENSKQYSDPFDGGNFTITFAGGGNDGKYYTTGAGIRTYGGGTITIASKDSKYDISEIEFTWDGSYAPAADEVASPIGYSRSTAKWTGSAQSVVLTRPSGSGHWRLQSVKVTYSSAN